MYSLQWGEWKGEGRGKGGVDGEREGGAWREEMGGEWE